MSRRTYPGRRKNVILARKNHFCSNVLFFAAPDAILQIFQCGFCEQHFITKPNGNNANQQQF